MIRRLSMLLFATALAFAFITTPSASAQCGYNNTQACPLDAPANGFKNAPDDNEALDALGNAFAERDPITAQGSDGGDQSADEGNATASRSNPDAPRLAFTGAETDVLTWVGAGLIATGALSLAARRRILNTRD